MNAWDLKQDFEAGVFSEQVPGGRCSVLLHCEASGLRAVTESGQQFFLRYEQMQLELGGASGNMLFCRNPDRSLTLFCEDRQFRATLEFQSGSILTEQLSRVFADRKNDRSRWRSILLLSLAGLAVLLYAGYYSVLALGRAAVTTLPVKVDQQIGELAWSQMDHGGPEVNDPLIVDPCRQIVERLAPHAALAGLKFEIAVIDSPDVNAFCLPGGKMVIFTGLLKAARTPEEVAGVVSHEMAHATLRHGLQSAVRSAGVVIAAELLIGDAAGLVALGAELGQQAALTSYSREQETEADAEGVRMLHAAAMDPLSLAEFFEQLKQQGQDVPAAIAWISTHPQHDVRIASIRARVAELPPQQYRSLEVNWDGLKQRLQN
ncbi:MAG: M48 family metallopeptidase [Planctomycetota bacterium]